MGGGLLFRPKGAGGKGCWTLGGFFTDAGGRIITNTEGNNALDPLPNVGGGVTTACDNLLLPLRVAALVTVSAAAAAAARSRCC